MGLKHPVYSAKDDKDKLQTRSKSGIFRRKRKFSSGSESDSDDENLAAKKHKMSSKLEHTSIAQPRSLEDKVKTNQELVRVKEKGKSSLSRKPSQLPVLSIKKVTLPGSKPESRRSSVRHHNGLKRATESKSENFDLSKNLKRKSRNSINALLDAQLFKPDIPTLKPTMKPDQPTDDDSTDEEDVLCKSWVKKQKAKPKVSLSESHSEDEDKARWKIRSTRATPVQSLDYDSLVRDSEEEKPVDGQSSSTMSTRSRTGTLRRKSHAYGEVKVDETVDQTEGEHISFARSTRSRSGILMRKSYLAEREGESKKSAMKKETIKTLMKGKETVSQSLIQQNEVKSKESLQMREKQTVKTPINHNRDVKATIKEKELTEKDLKEIDCVKSRMINKETVIPTNKETVLINQPPIEKKMMKHPIQEKEASKQHMSKSEIIKQTANEQERTVNKPDLKILPISGLVRRSNSMVDAVKVKCKLCSQNVAMTRMRGHTKSAHKMNIADYKRKFGVLKDAIIEAVFHKCGICQQDVLLDSDEIATHLKRCHQITHRRYNEQFMQIRVNSALTDKDRHIIRQETRAKCISPPPHQPKTNQNVTNILSTPTPDNGLQKPELHNHPAPLLPGTTKLQSSVFEKSHEKALKQGGKEIVGSSTLENIKLDRETQNNQLPISLPKSKLSPNQTTLVENKVKQSITANSPAKNGPYEPLKTSRVSASKVEMKAEMPSSKQDTDGGNAQDDDVVFVHEVEGMSQEEKKQLKAIEDSFDGDELFDSDDDSSDEE